MRKILHIDMDAFYASVEQRDDPTLKGKPVAVGGAGGRGVVAAASYEARKYGVRSAMPSKTAARLCPDLIFVKPRFHHYREISRQIREVFFSFTDLVEPLSLDEAYLDVTQNKQGLESATLIAKYIKRDILDSTSLTASAGVSMNKFLAKTASGMNKPDGLTLVLPGDAETFLEQLPIRKFHGIGAKTAEKMHKLGIRTGADLKRHPELQLARLFGKSGRYYYRIVRAIDDRPVKPDRIRKSLGAERTFQEDLSSEADMLARLESILDTVQHRMKEARIRGKTITLKIKYHDFEQTTRSRTESHYITDRAEAWGVIQTLLNTPSFPDRPVRLLGISFSSLDSEQESIPQQLTLNF